MIRVKQTASLTRTRSLVITGHAGAAEKGHDLVCAAVSGIGVGLLNAIDALCEDSCLIEMKEGYISIQVKQDGPVLQTILETGIIQLQTVAASNADYVSFLKEEV